MKNRFFSALTLSAMLFLGSCSNTTESDQFVKQNFDFIEGQLDVAIEAVDVRRAELKAAGELREGLQEQVVPRTIEADGTFSVVGQSDWTCGFFPGTLWYTYEYTKDPKWADQAKKFQAAIEGAKYRTTTHDLGFMIYCSFGNGYRLTGDESFRESVIIASDSLCTRYDDRVGLICSWSHSRDRWGYPVIIDNMMNLEMLMEAYKMTGTQKYYDIAISHADKTLANHFRADNSSFHVVDYDADGNAIKHQTAQGYADSSAWARGQGWALYGYTMMYRETGFQRYLDQAIKVAEFIINHPRLPKDKVPYWDFDAPNIPNEPRDVSAGTIYASALYELGFYAEGKKEAYHAVADQIIDSISENYLAEKGGSFGFVTLHSVGHLPKDIEIDVPLNYADYYYAEALLRRDRISKGEKLF